jgi:hypothetical protein
MTDEGRQQGRRHAPARVRAAALAILVATLVACDGSLGVPQNTPDPDVRGDFSGYFVWAVAEPTVALGSVDPAVAEKLVGRAADTIEPDRDARFGISIVATFPSKETAEEHAAAVRGILAASARWYADPANAAALAQLDDERPARVTPPEVAALQEQLLAPGERGVGWGGKADGADDAVHTIGPVLVVTGLKSETAAEVEAGASLPIHPLAHLLAAAGGEVLLEGDRSGEGTIVADVSCQPADAASGMALLDELGDALLTAGQFSTRPPWIGPPPTAREALARATFRRYLQGTTAAMGDQHLQELARRIADAPQEDHAAAIAEFGEYVRKRGLELMNGEVDPEVLALILDTKAQSDSASRQAWTRALGELMGRLPVESGPYGDEPSPDDHARLTTSGTMRLHDGRLEMGWLTFGRLAAGLPSLAGYLTANGCQDTRIGLVDFDEVRVD